jgi:hypothetical protein
MYTKNQLLQMNSSTKYSSVGGWIKNIENIDEKKAFTLYATNNASISNGRQYIALPSDKILTTNDYLKYNIMK